MWESRPPPQPPPQPSRHRGTARRARNHGRPALCLNKRVSLALFSRPFSLSASFTPSPSLSPPAPRARPAHSIGPRRQGPLDCHARPAPDRSPVLPPRREAGQAAPAGRTTRQTQCGAQGAVGTTAQPRACRPAPLRRRCAGTQGPRDCHEFTVRQRTHAPPDKACLQPPMSAAPLGTGHGQHRHGGRGLRSPSRAPPAHSHGLGRCSRAAAAPQRRDAARARAGRHAPGRGRARARPQQRGTAPGAGRHSARGRALAPGRTRRAAGEWGGRLGGEGARAD